MKKRSGTRILWKAGRPRGPSTIFDPTLRFPGRPVRLLRVEKEMRRAETAHQWPSSPSRWPRSSLPRGVDFDEVGSLCWKTLPDKSVSSRNASAA